MNNLGNGLKAGLSVLVFAALAWGGPQQAASNANAAANSKTAPPSVIATPDHAGSYFHFMLARRLEELGGIAGREGDAKKESDDYQQAITEFKKAIADDPESPFLRLQLAELYSGVGRVPEAIGLVENVLKTDPTDIHARLQLSGLYMSVGRVQEAVQEIKGVLKEKPDNLEAHRLLGRIYYVSALSGKPGPEGEANFAKAIREFKTLIRLDPNDAESVLVLARLYSMDNQPAKAEAAFKELLGAHPSSQAVRVQLARLYSDENKYDQAVQTLKQIPAGQMDSQTLSMLGRDEMRAGHFDEAKADFEKALAEHPSNPKILGEYAEALMYTGNTDEARQELEKMTKVAPGDPGTYLKLERLDQAEGRWNHARQDLAQAKKLAENVRGFGASIQYQQATLDGALGENSKAIALFEDLLQQDTQPDGQYSGADANNRAIFLEQLGMIYQTNEQYDKALAEFRQILPLGPEQAPDGELLVIQTLQLSHHLQQAQAEMASALKKYPSNRRLQLKNAEMMADEGHPKQAVRQLEALLQGKPSDRDVELEIAQVDLQAKHYADAEKATRRALALSTRPDAQNAAIFMLGSIYDHEKKYDRAESQFKKVLASDPLNGEAANYLGYMFAERGVHLDQSVMYIKQALKLEPNNGAYLDSLGWAYYRMNRYQDAEAPLQKAVQQLSNDPTVLDHLGHVYMRLGKLVQAQQEWQHALAEWPKAYHSEFGPKQAAHLRKELKKLDRELAKDQKKKSH